MKEFKGTKGKWIKSKKSIGFVFALKSDDNTEVNAFSLNINNDGMLPDSEIEANAKLIASAPEMFDELKETIIDLKILRNQIESEVINNHLFKGMPELIQKWIDIKEQLLTKITE